MPRPLRRPDLPGELVAAPRTTARWRSAGVHSELSGPLWTPLLRGVHAWRPDDVSDPMLRILAVVAQLPRDAALSGWAALHWLGVTSLDGRSGPAASVLVPVTVCTGPVGRMRPRSGLVSDRSTLLDADLTMHRGVRITTAERSCLDIGRRFGAEEGLVAADATVRAGLTTRAALDVALTRLVGLPGVPQARTTVRLVDGGAESVPESRLRYVWVVEAGLPVPLVNPTLVDASGQFVARTDVFDPEAGVVGEYDGAQHRELSQHTADNVREESLEDLNLTVTRVTAVDLWRHRGRLVSRLQAAHLRGLRRDRRQDTWGIRQP